MAVSVDSTWIANKAIKNHNQNKLADLTQYIEYWEGEEKRVEDIITQWTTRLRVIKGWVEDAKVRLDKFELLPLIEEKNDG